ncbi:hypothetical protein SAMN04488026_102964 [Aliiruegeria lutimaris]|uniref:Uncharacterized protein n=1 Tax=Aliiruegeria lutimaris TaxID=571298 RepID=A0A1G8YQ15_9RHOB|nr:hypothetical protein SAMN04488026_102964 [Aliiruegeria lutimaris]
MGNAMRGEEVVDADISNAGSRFDLRRMLDRLDRGAETAFVSSLTEVGVATATATQPDRRHRGRSLT